MIDGLSSSQFLLFHTLTVGTILIGVARAWRYPRISRLLRFMRHYQVPDTEETRAVVYRYLRRRRIVRTTGFLLSFPIPPFLLLWWTRSAYEQLPWGTILPWIAFASVAVTGDLTAARRGTGSASLTPRRLSDYKIGFTKHDELWLSVVLLLLTLVGVFVPAQALPTTPSAAFWGLFSFGIGALAVSRVSQEVLVRRKQPFANLELAQAEYALRKSAIIGISGFGYLGAIAAIGATMASLAEVRHGWERTALGLGGLIIVALGFGLLFGFLSDLAYKEQEQLA